MYETGKFECNWWSFTRTWIFSANHRQVIHRLDYYLLWFVFLKLLVKFSSFQNCTLLKFAYIRICNIFNISKKEKLILVLFLQILSLNDCQQCKIKANVQNFFNFKTSQGFKSLKSLKIIQSLSTVTLNNYIW